MATDSINNQLLLSLDPRVCRAAHYITFASAAGALDATFGDVSKTSPWTAWGCMQVATDVINRQPDSIHWLDQGTEHPHRIALSVQVEQLSNTLLALRRGFDDRSLQVHLLTCTMLRHWQPISCVWVSLALSLDYVRMEYDSGHSTQIATASCV